jgi:hypothetical protein
MRSVWNWFLGPLVVFVAVYYACMLAMTIQLQKAIVHTSIWLVPLLIIVNILVYVLTKKFSSFLLAILSISLLVLSLLNGFFDYEKMGMGFFAILGAVSVNIIFLVLLVIIISIFPEEDSFGRKETWYISSPGIVLESKIFWISLVLIGSWASLLIIGGFIGVRI